MKKAFPISAGRAKEAAGIACCRQPPHAFTLLEMLLVIAIIGFLAAVALPSLRGFGKSNAMTSASRQLLDDLGLARKRAISERTTVYVLFVPPDFYTFTNRPDFSKLDLQQKTQFTNLCGLQYVGYAPFTRRTVGEQPGQENPRYLTTWKHLPEGVFIAEAKFISLSNSFNWSGRLAFPIPNARTNSLMAPLPYLAFDYQGRLTTNGNQPAFKDDYVPLARGSVMYARDANRQFSVGAAEANENPPGNSTNDFNHIQIDWLTGRARIVRPEIQ